MSDKRRTGSGTSTQTDEQPRASDPQEIADLPRREGRPLAREVIVSEVATIRELRADGERDAGVRAHRVGSRLKKLYNGRADDVYGTGSFAVFAQQHCDVTRTDAYDFVRIAHHFSEEECRQLGITRLRRYLAFFRPAGLTSWDALKVKAFPLPDGETIRLGDKVPPSLGEIQAAYLLLTAKKMPREPRKAVEEASRCEEAYKLAAEEDPTLAGARVRFVAEDGEVLMRTGSLSHEERVAVARFVLRLERA